MFNKKFDGKYLGVRRPVICNGLKEIKAYKIEVVVPEEPKPQAVAQPEPEPEPEAEPEAEP